MAPAVNLNVVYTVDNVAVCKVRGVIGVAENTSDTITTANVTVVYTVVDATPYVITNKTSNVIVSDCGRIKKCKYNLHNFTM